MTRFIKRLYLKWKYRTFDSNVCCCGGDVSDGGYSCTAPCRSLKEYTITSELDKPKKGWTSA